MWWKLRPDLWGTSTNRWYPVSYCSAVSAHWVAKYSHREVKTGSSTHSLPHWTPTDDEGNIRVISKKHHIHISNLDISDFMRLVFVCLIKRLSPSNMASDECNQTLKPPFITNRLESENCSQWGGIRWEQVCEAVSVWESRRGRNRCSQHAVFILYNSIRSRFPTNQEVLFNQNILVHKNHKVYGTRCDLFKVGVGFNLWIQLCTKRHSQNETNRKDLFFIFIFFWRSQKKV